MTEQTTIKPATNSPCVSVVMPVYNGEAYLPQAVESILNQTFNDFEFIIIDDGSTDDTWQILTTYAAQDARIRLLRNEKNLKLIKTLNKGMALVQGKYIARQDADDVSLPDRLAAQVAYLEQHPKIGVLGTAYYRLFTDGQRSLRQPPLTDTEIRWRLLFGNIWCHSSMMFRRQLLAKGKPVYNELPDAEDYEFWLRLSKRTRVATLPVPLVIYRVHESSLSATQPEPIERMVTAISADQIKTLLSHQTFSQNEILRLRRCHHPQRLSSEELALCPVMFQLFDAFTQQPEIDCNIVHRLRRQWVKQVLANIPAKYWLNLLTMNLLGAILRYDTMALLTAGFIHLPKRTFRQIYGGRNAPS